MRQRVEPPRGICESFRVGCQAEKLTRARKVGTSVALMTHSRGRTASAGRTRESGEEQVAMMVGRKPHGPAMGWRRIRQLGAGGLATLGDGDRRSVRFVGFVTFASLHGGVPCGGKGGIARLERVSRLAAHPCFARGE